MQWETEAVQIVAMFPSCMARRAGVPVRPLPDQTMFADPVNALARVQAFTAEDLDSLRAFAKDGTGMVHSYRAQLFPITMSRGIHSRAEQLRAMAKQAAVPDEQAIEGELQRYAGTSLEALIAEATRPRPAPGRTG